MEDLYKQACEKCGAVFAIPKARLGPKAVFVVRCTACGSPIRFDGSKFENVPPSEDDVAKRRAEAEESIKGCDLNRIRGLLEQRFGGRPSPVPVRDVEAFEHRCGIHLPDDYRAFLTTVANGGIGPYEGLLPLGMTYDPSTGDMQPLSQDECAQLSKPFTGFVKDEEIEDANWDGLLPLGWAGCTMWAWLVVTGPERGKVWESDGNLIPAATPLCRPVTFLEWYAIWLQNLSDEEAGRISARLVAEPASSKAGWLRRVGSSIGRFLGRS